MVNVNQLRLFGHSFILDVCTKETLVQSVSIKECCFFLKKAVSWEFLTQMTSNLDQQFYSAPAVTVPDFKAVI